MKRLFVKAGLVVLAMGLLMACSNDSEEESFNGNENEKEGYWNLSGFVEMTPQSTPPYILLIKWDDEKGKEALEQYIAENHNIVLDRFDFGPDDQCYLTTTKVIQSQDFFVSTSYKTRYTIKDNEYVTVLPRIVVKLGTGNNINPIQEKYADVMTLEDDTYNRASMGSYIFKCNLRTSREVLRLASELFQRTDVEWTEPEMYIPIELD